LVNGDTLNEPDETFLVNLTNAGNATIVDGQGVGTVANDDPVPQLSINDVSVTEGNSGTTSAIFTVNLSAASGQTVTVNYATADGSGTAGSDYQSTSGTLTFNPGETNKSITSLVNGDTAFESDETFVANLSGAAHATIADSQAVGTILNDDAAPGYTPSGSNVTVQGNGVEITFSQVNSPGTTTMTAISPASAGSTPGGYVVNGSSVAFDLTTTAAYAAPIDLCFAMPSVTEAEAFNALAVLHNEGGVLVDRTMSRDFATKKVCGRVNSLSPFLVASKITAQFQTAAVSVNEGGVSVPVTVTRTGDTSGPATVNYATLDTAGGNPCNVFNGVASPRCDYAGVIGTVQFAAGVSSKTISIPVIDDAYAEGSETFSISLSSPAGAVLGAPATATITITDNETVPGANPVDNKTFFIRLQYIDFLGREPEPDGLQFYLDILNGCQPSDIECNKYTRGAISANFFRSPEFQRKGSYVMYLYMVSLGQRAVTPAELNDPSKIDRPHYGEFIVDLQSISDPTDDPVIGEARKVALTDAWMQRAEIQAKYPNTMSNAMFVQTLFNTAGVTVSNQNWAAELTAGTKTRAQVLREFAESPEVNTKFYKPAFVTMEYFGYLRRDPEDCKNPSNWTGGDPNQCGYIFHNNRFHLAADPDFLENTIVRGFIESPEYRQRFGPP
jgi:hypothetical protein